MTNDMFKLASLTALVAFVPALALAQLSLGDTVGTDMAEITSALEAQGAEVLEIENEDGVIEVEYVLEGTEYEAEIDSASGAVVAVELEEADDAEDDDDEDEDEDDKDGDRDAG